MYRETSQSKFRLDIEVCHPIITTTRQYFKSLKIMRQWQKRNDLKNNITCLGYKEYTKSEAGHWEQFVVIGKNILTLSQLYKIIHDLEN
jgi:hypothetical protein